MRQLCVMLFVIVIRQRGKGLMGKGGADCNYSVFVFSSFSRLWSWRWWLMTAIIVFIIIILYFVVVLRTLDIHTYSTITRGSYAFVYVCMYVFSKIDYCPSKVVKNITMQSFVVLNSEIYSPLFNIYMYMDATM